MEWRERRTELCSLQVVRMPPPKQERFNAKARGSVAGGSHKKRKRPRQTQLIDEEEAEHGVSQSPLVLESVQGIGEAETLGRGKMSAKKRKRMESYVVRLSAV